MPDWLPARTDVLLSAAHPTCIGLTRRGEVFEECHGIGDGDVPAEAAWLEGASHWRCDAFHPTFPLDGDARGAVVSLLQSGECGLARIADRDALGALAPPPVCAVPGGASPADAAGASTPAGLRERLDGHTPRRADALWLLGYDGAADGG